MLAWATFPMLWSLFPISLFSMHSVTNCDKDLPPKKRPSKTSTENSVSEAPVARASVGQDDAIPCVQGPQISICASDKERPYKQVKLSSSKILGISSYRSPRIGEQYQAVLPPLRSSLPTQPKKQQDQDNLSRKIEGEWTTTTKDASERPGATLYTASARRRRGLCSGL